MKALSITFLFTFVFLTTSFVQSQNYILNSSFEEYTSCPTKSGQLANAIPWVIPSQDQQIILIFVISV